MRDIFWDTNLQHPNFSHGYLFNSLIFICLKEFLNRDDLSSFFVTAFDDYPVASFSNHTFTYWVILVQFTQTANSWKVSRLKRFDKLPQDTPSRLQLRHHLLPWEAGPLLQKLANIFWIFCDCLNQNRWKLCALSNTIHINIARIANAVQCHN